jgi:hypothetical protein
LKQSRRTNRLTLGLTGAIAALACWAPAAMAGEKPTTTSDCAEQSFTQPFLSAKDRNWYTLVDGQGESGFTGSGWTLRGGAAVAPSDDGAGNVLDLPSGAVAVSPPVCVTEDYPKARMLVQTVEGGDDVDFHVSYLGTKSWDVPRETGHVKGKKRGLWNVSDPVDVKPYKDVDGWQTVRFTLEAGGKTSRFQVRDLYVDPRMR